MGRLVVVILFLAALGAFLSGVLLFDHYHPEMGLGACGEGEAGGCRTVNQSRYADFLGFPVAAWGAAYFCIVFLASLLTLGARGDYYKHLSAFLTPLAALGLIIQAFLAWAMYRIDAICYYCVATYAVNLAILGLAILLTVRLKRIGDHRFLGHVRGLLKPGRMNPDQRAAALMGLIGTLLVFANVFWITNALKVQSQGDVATRLQQFYDQPVEELNPPAGIQAFGPDRAPIHIRVFTDFLCTACYQYHEVESEILSKYPDRVRVSYYNFPLDGNCNPAVSQTVYRNACVAARAMIAADQADVFQPYAERFYDAYPRIYRSFNQTVAEKLASGLIDGQRFATLMASTRVDGRLQQDIESAERIEIRATPTLFINGRRFVGNPGRGLMEKIVETEVQRRRIERFKNRINPLD